MYISCRVVKKLVYLRYTIIQGGKHLQKLYTVSLCEDGKWKVFKDGSKHAARVFNSETSARDYAKNHSLKEAIKMGDENIKLYKVRSREDGKWEVFKEGNVQATRVFDFESEAFDYVEDLSKQEDVAVISNQNVDEAPQEEPVKERLENLGFFKSLISKLYHLFFY